jgi:hypothetical protein
VPVRPALPATVVITQARHPLEGRDLRVLGWMRRLGRLELMLELPDGSKRLIPAEWTSQHDDPDPGPGTGTLGRTADLLGLSMLVSALSARSAGGREQAARTHLPRRMIVQPVQLSLLPEEVPAPLPDLIGQLPGEDVAAAVALLAGLIARAQAAGVAETAGAGDE